MKPTVLIGEAWGENEEKLKSSFIGASGIELLRMAGEAGLIELTAEDFGYMSKYWQTGRAEHLDMVWNLHPEVYRTNVFALRPPGNRVEALCGPRESAIAGYPQLVKGKARGYVQAEYEAELERLGDELLTVDPNLVICLGNTPLWALTGLTGVSKLRGTTRTSTHTAAGYKLLPTYHPAAVLRQWELRPTTVMDLGKARREAEYPEIRRPKRLIWIEPEIEDIIRFIDTVIDRSRVLSVDIETSGNQITEMGFGYAEVAIVIPFRNMNRADRSYWPTKAEEVRVWLLIKSVMEDGSIKKLFQNGMYDIAFTWRSYGIKVMGAEHDSMLCHHALQPESLKGLGYLGSIYSEEGAWKQERRVATIKKDE